MKLHPPFIIGPRFTPTLRIGDGWLSYDRGQFIIDLPDGTEHIVRDFRPAPADRNNLLRQFSALLNFLSACAESRAHAHRHGRDEMDGENSDLFPPDVG